MLPSLNSISAIANIIQTRGSMPVVVMAEDFEDYACKYGSPYKLINEYLAHQFLQIWEMRVFPAAFINIKKEHVLDDMLSPRLRLFDFDKPTFGLQYKNEAIDASNILLGLKNDGYELAKFTNRFSLLKIALFDLWLANNDRNHHNYNILIHDYEFIPIDHVDIFDGGRLGNELAQLTDEDSLINSDLALTFLNSKAKLEEYVEVLIEKFPTFVYECGNALPHIIANLPGEWCDDKPLLQQNIITSVIENTVWLSQTNTTFLQLIHNFNR
jgi:hypothetical protein